MKLLNLKNFKDLEISRKSQSKKSLLLVLVLLGLVLSWGVFGEDVGRGDDQSWSVEVGDIDEPAIETEGFDVTFGGTEVEPAILRETRYESIDNVWLKIGKLLKIDQAEKNKVYDPPNEEWVSFNEVYVKFTVSKQYRLTGEDRPGGVDVDRIVLHHTGGSSASGAYNTLVGRGFSAHYILDRDGTIYYVVDEEKKALHASDFNSRSIGIEIVNTGDESMEYTDAQYSSIRYLINDIAERWSLITIDNEHVIGHFQIAENKWDPSPNFNWARIGLPDHETSLGKVPGGEGY